MSKRGPLPWTVTDHRRSKQLGLDVGYLAAEPLIKARCKGLIVRYPPPKGERIAKHKDPTPSSLLNIGTTKA